MLWVIVSYRESNTLYWLGFLLFHGLFSFIAELGSLGIQDYLFQSNARHVAKIKDETDDEQTVKSQPVYIPLAAIWQPGRKGDLLN